MRPRHAGDRGLDRRAVWPRMAHARDGHKGPLHPRPVRFSAVKEILFIFWALTAPWSSLNSSFFEWRPHVAEKTFERCQEIRKANEGWALFSRCLEMTTGAALLAAEKAWLTIPPRMALGLDPWDEKQWRHYNGFLWAGERQ